MIELCRDKLNDVVYSILSYDVFNQNGNIIVEFQHASYSDNNKWQQADVLTDLTVFRYLLSEIYSGTDCDGVRIKEFIKDNFDGSYGIIGKVNQIAADESRITISLPTSVHSKNRSGEPTSARKFKDSVMPLIVDIDGEDVSHAFIDFGDFGADAVETAYQALVNGKMPQSYCDIFYYEGVEELHNKLVTEFTNGGMEAN